MKSNRAIFFALWRNYCQQARVSKDESDDARKAFISLHFPDKNSLTQCSASDIDYLCHKLSEVLDTTQTTKKIIKEGDAMRKKIIAILCELYNFRKQRGEKIVADMEKINEFLREKTQYKCNLNALSMGELSKVVTQMVKLQKNVMNDRRKKMKVEWGKK